MTINDRIYGKFEISSPVIIEIMNSEAVQRLKGIAQFGVPDQFYHKTGYTRYEHSVGVMLLLKKLGANEEEQIAGLLHDVSHTAFSHTIDWVLRDGTTEDFQDEQHEDYINNSEIPGILKKHKFKTSRITDYHHFGLLERDIPDLCADRIDYSIREFPSKVAKECEKALTTKDGLIVFTNQESALIFAQNYLKLQSDHWGGFEATIRIRILANMLQEAMRDGLITMADFWKDDDHIINKLDSSNNEKITNKLKILRGKTLPKSKNTRNQRKKFRHVDPLFIQNGELVRLSIMNKKFASELDQARKQNARGIDVPIID